MFVAIVSVAQNAHSEVYLSGLHRVLKPANLKSLLQVVSQNVIANTRKFVL